MIVAGGFNSVGEICMRHTPSVAFVNKGAHSLVLYLAAHPLPCPLPHKKLCNNPGQKCWDT